MKTPIVCLSFDFDALSLWLARGLTTPTPLSRGEFGAVGAERVLALLKERDVKSTWFVPGLTLETYPEVCKSVVGAGHEIGHHGWTHVPPAQLTRDEEEAGLERANESIRRLTGRYATGYRSPSWDLSEHTVQLLLTHGFAYDSSLMGHDYMPYYVRQGDVVPLDEPATFGSETPLLELPVSWSLDDFPHFEYLRAGGSVIPGLQNASNVMENWVEDFLYLKENLEWGIITFTFHPFVIGRGHRMRLLDRLIRRFQGEGAEFVTMQEAVQLYRAHHGSTMPNK
jgi:peptidoglycan/xylan/chitin deacetylase (PgdA/CDA1 family)